MPNDPRHQDILNAAVWQACDTFRGTIDPCIYKDYILSMLFLKNLSDVWQDLHDDYRTRYGPHPELIEEMLRAERFVLPPGANFYALHEARHRPGNGERIDKTLQAIEEANLGKLRDVFQDIRFNSSKLGDEARKNTRLRHLLEDFAKPELDLRPCRIGAFDAIGGTYEFLIKNFSATRGKHAGEFYTPPEVSQLMTLLMAPQEGDRICDPACGTGSLLMKCGQLIRQQSGHRKYALYGQEAVRSTWALAKMNLFLHGEDNHRVEWGDTLRKPRLLDPDGTLTRFDIVVANPPFSLEQWGHDEAENDPHKRYRRGMPPRIRGEYAFILHMIEVMKPDTGRMAVVVPHGVLFRGAAEGRIRQKLIEENLLDMVIGLPEKLFYGTGIAAAILVFKKCRPDDKVLFVDASRDYQVSKNQNQLRDCDLQKILSACAARTGVDNFAHLAGPQEIAANDYNLNIPRYVATFDQKPEIDLISVCAERQKLKAELAVLEERMAGYVREIDYE